MSHLSLSDDILQLGDLGQHYLLIGQHVVQLLGDLVLSHHTDALTCCTVYEPQSLTHKPRHPICRADMFQPALLLTTVLFANTDTNKV